MRNSKRCRLTQKLSVVRANVKTKFGYWIGFLIAGTVMFSGCKKAEDTGTGQDGATTQSGSALVDTSRVEKSFESAPAEDQSKLRAAMGSVKAGDYEAAMRQLRSLASDVKLNEEQQAAVRDLISRVQTRVSAVATEVVEDTKDAAREAAQGVRDAAIKARDSAAESSVVEGAKKLTEDAKESAKDAAEDVRRGAGNVLEKLGGTGQGDK